MDIEAVETAVNTEWLLISATLVLLMTPGLAFFYGGMVRAKSVLNMMMMSFVSIGIVGVLWVLYGYSMTFGQDVGAGLLGNPGDYLGLKGLIDESGAGLAFVGFQAVFAMITAALISGAIADRAKFGAWCVFVAVWVTVVYFPVAHWVFDFDNDSGHIGGWIANDLKAIDLAGGTAVHINAGAAGLALALVLGKRVGWPKEPMRPHSLPLVMLGAGLLWFGWFGFNAGSALTVGGLASLAWINTFIGGAAAMLGWLVTEKIRDGHSTSLGAASGVVAGLVAITPACGAVTPIGAIAVGAISGVLCALAVGLKYKLGYDDSLDVVGVHLVGGVWGTLAIGLLASAATPTGVDGLFYGGGVKQLGLQAVGAFAVLAYSFVVTFIIGKVIALTMGFRLDEEQEVAGIDLAEHAESGYDLGAGGAGAFRPGISTKTEEMA